MCKYVLCTAIQPHGCKNENIYIYNWFFILTVVLPLSLAFRFYQIVLMCQ